MYYMKILRLQRLIMIFPSHAYDFCPFCAPYTRVERWIDVIRILDKTTQISNYHTYIKRQCFQSLPEHELLNASGDCQKRVDRHQYGLIEIEAGIRLAINYTLELGGTSYSVTTPSVQTSCSVEIDEGTSKTSLRIWYLKNP